jgi:hypothetical protein
MLRTFLSALASACVFPGSSREEPVPRTMPSRRAATLQWKSILPPLRAPHGATACAGRRLAKRKETEESTRKGFRAKCYKLMLLSARPDVVGQRKEVPVMKCGMP